jgi:chemotaxis protein MotB
VALAQRVQELNRYRSDFFGRLREILSDRENIRIVGDRFVFQSEVLFPVGGAELDAAGRAEMSKLAAAVLELAQEIPDEINWVLRVDGHTDASPLTGTGRYADNWELSSARATSVVKYLISLGVPAERLAAAGFGEYQPIAEGDTPEARNQNRRIELKLTER